MNGDREILSFPFQLTTSRIGNLATYPVYPSLTICDDHIQYIHTIVWHMLRYLIKCRVAPLAEIKRGNERS